MDAEGITTPNRHFAASLLSVSPTAIGCTPPDFFGISINRDAVNKDMHADGNPPLAMALLREANASSSRCLSEHLRISYKCEGFRPGGPAPEPGGNEESAA